MVPGRLLMPYRLKTEVGECILPDDALRPVSSVVVTWPGVEYYLVPDPSRNDKTPYFTTGGSASRESCVDRYTGREKVRWLTAIGYRVTNCDHEYPPLVRSELFGEGGRCVMCGGLDDQAWSKMQALCEHDWRTRECFGHCLIRCDKCDLDAPFGIAGI